MFEQPCDQHAARRVLGLPAEGGVVTVSGGGWGVGDLDGAVAAAVEAGAAAVLVLCGRNEAVANRLRARFVAEPVVRILGFTDQMSEVLAASDVLIHSTAGFIDAGWDGHVTLELSNIATLPITLYPGMKIGQISFLRLTTPADVPDG